MNSAVAHFDGKFKHWDVDNEMLHGSFFVDRLGGSIHQWMYQRAHQLDPDIKLFTNDFNILSIDQNFTYIQTDEYVAQIQGLLNQSAPITGIGVQGHIWAEDILFNPDVIKTRLDKLSVFGLPVWITEFDVGDASDVVRADKLELVYRTAYSLPYMEGIMMWIFWANDSWRGANAALVNSNWTLNEEGRRFEALMSEWTTNTSGVTDLSGIFSFRGFHGTYEVTLTPPGSGAEKRTFVLDPGTGTQMVTLQLSGATPTPTPVVTSTPTPTSAPTPTPTPTPTAATTPTLRQHPRQRRHLYRSF